METRNRNLIISAAIFFLGALFVLSDSASINANVIGESGTSASLAAIIGILMIICAGAYFMLLMSVRVNKDQHDLEKFIREPVNNNSEVRNVMQHQEIHDKYEHEHKK